MGYLYNVIKNPNGFLQLEKHELVHYAESNQIIMLKGFFNKSKTFVLSFFPAMVSVISRKGLIPKNKQNKDISYFIKSVFGWISKQKKEYLSR